MIPPAGTTKRSPDDDRRAQRPEVRRDVGDRAVHSLQVAECADVLRREKLQAESAFRVEFPAAADHDRERLRLVRVRSERMHVVADERHTGATLDEEALRLPRPELSDALNRGRPDAA